MCMFRHFSFSHRRELLVRQILLSIEKNQQMASNKTDITLQKQYNGRNIEILTELILLASPYSYLHLPSSY